MSRVFGDLRQLGYVINDIEAGINYWHQVNGVGPWFLIEDVPLSRFEYMGSASDLKMSIALSFSGGVQVELIQPRNDAPSMYKDFLDSGQEGLQHVGYCPAEYEQAKFKASTNGFLVGQEGVINNRGAFVYYQTTGHYGTCVELIEFNRLRKFQFATMEKICREWDGSNPIRTTLPVPED